MMVTLHHCREVKVTGTWSNYTVKIREQWINTHMMFVGSLLSYSFGSSNYTVKIRDQWINTHMLFVGSLLSYSFGSLPKKQCGLQRYNFSISININKIIPPQHANKPPWSRLSSFILIETFCPDSMTSSWQSEIANTRFMLQFLLLHYFPSIFSPIIFFFLCVIWTEKVGAKEKE